MHAACWWTLRRRIGTKCMQPHMCRCDPDTSLLSITLLHSTVCSRRVCDQLPPIYRQACGMHPGKGRVPASVVGGSLDV